MQERLQDAAYLSVEHWKLYDSWNVINVLYMHREPYSRSPYWGMIKPIENPILWAFLYVLRDSSLTQPSYQYPVKLKLCCSRHSIYLPSEIGTTLLHVKNGGCKCLVLNPETREGWVISFTLWPYYLSRRSLWNILGMAPVKAILEATAKRNHFCCRKLNSIVT